MLLWVFFVFCGKVEIGHSCRILVIFYGEINLILLASEQWNFSILDLCFISKTGYFKKGTTCLKNKQEISPNTVNDCLTQVFMKKRSESKKLRRKFLPRKVDVTSW